MCDIDLVIPRPTLPVLTTDLLYETTAENEWVKPLIDDRFQQSC